MIPSLERASKNIRMAQSNPELTFSSWPTIPQVYMKGEFVGGCDIMLSHYRDGDLKKMLQDCKAIEPSKEWIL